ncbi:MAG: 30S ribosomal protein THX [Bacteroidota bacterium]
MGKGDMKTRRGKIFRGTYGKTRPRYKKQKQLIKVTTGKKQ